MTHNFPSSNSFESISILKENLTNLWNQNFNNFSQLFWLDLNNSISKKESGSTSDTTFQNSFINFTNSVSKSLKKIKNENDRIKTLLRFKFSELSHEISKTPQKINSVISKHEHSFLSTLNLTNIKNNNNNNNFTANIFKDEFKKFKSEIGDTLTQTLMSNLTNISDINNNNSTANIFKNEFDIFKSDLSNIFTQNLTPNLLNKVSNASNVLKNEFKIFKSNFSDIFSQELTTNILKNEFEIFKSNFLDIFTKKLTSNLKNIKNENNNLFKIEFEKFKDQITEVFLQKLIEVSHLIDINFNLDMEVLEKIVRKVNKELVLANQSDPSKMDLNNDTFILIATIKENIKNLEASIQTLPYLRFLNTIHNCNCPCIS